MHFSSFLQFCPHCGSSNFILNNEKSKSCKNCNFTFYMNASAAVAVFILNKKGELLVCIRGKEPAKGSFDLPGGFVDSNESAEDAVKREIKEELNVNIITQEYLFSLPNIYEYSGLSIPTLDLFYNATIDDYLNIKPSDDVAECQFIAIEELNPDLFGLSSIKKAIKTFIEQSNF